MAIYHFSGTVISRSKGKSAIASAAYRSGEKLYDERQDKTFDYGRKQDVFYKEVMLPEGAPEWMVDREKLWNAVEKAENRKDSQLAREVHFSLPREFTKEQNIELAKEFVKNEFVSCGMVADLCIHEGKTKDGEEQTHAHVMLTMREITEEGFGLKETSWNARENMMLWRESWAEHANKHLALNGIDQKLDHRSYAEQGIDLTPQGKIGPKNLLDREQRIEEHRLIAKENGDKILEDPAIALKAITHHQSTFTHQDLARFINRHTVDADQFRLVYEKVKASEQIVALTDEHGRERFTTEEMLFLESKMLEDAIALKGGSHITARGNDERLVDTFLTPQQGDALDHITGDGDIKCLVGYAGTGKSRLLGEAKGFWEKEGYRVHGATLSGIAAENLEGASGIESRTLASRCYYWDRGKERLSSKDILVIDEAGMLGSRQVSRVLEEVGAGGAKVVLIGDPQQLQAIEAGAAFRAISEQTGFLELTEIRRQSEAWQQEATKGFALRQTQEAIALYEQHDCVHVFEKQEHAKTALVDKWNEARILQPDKTQIMLSYTRRDAQELNEMARDFRRENNELGEGQELRTASGAKEFAENDRIYFLRNDRGMGVKNGTLGTVEHIESFGKEEKGEEKTRQYQVTVRLDRDDLDGNPKTVTFDLKQYDHITHGYAATIHKAQGVTVDQSHILASKHLDSHAIYVGMSRHREKAELYWSKEEFADKKELEQVLGRDRSKDVTLDYMGRGFGEIYGQQEIRESGKREFMEEKSVADLVKEITQLGKEHGENESREQHFIRELREITQQAQNNPKEQKYHQEINEYLKQATINDENKKQCETNELKVFQNKVERERPKDAERERQEICRFTLPEERRAEKLIEKYRGFEERYHDLGERGGSNFSMYEAKDQMGRCAHEICHDKHAMGYLQKNDRELFGEMNKQMEQERKREKGFDLSL